MKKVFSSHSELAHVWAQGRQEEGRASDGRMFFNKGRLYSYGLHFCIARILPSGVVVYGNHTYSPSTGKHQSLARSAVSHRRKVYCEDPDTLALYNRDHTKRRMKGLLEDAVTERRVKPATRVGNKLEALRLAQEFNEYLAALPEAERHSVEPFDLNVLEVSEVERQIVRDYDAEVQARRQVRNAQTAERSRIRYAQLALAETEKIAKWRTHEYTYALHNVPTMLRLSKDGQSVETSRGADIPVSHAKRLWPLIENVRAVGKPLTDRDVHLGHYTLTEIKVDGSIVVGCHDIAYEEIERIAKALGLLEQEAV